MEKNDYNCMKVVDLTRSEAASMIYVDAPDSPPKNQESNTFSCQESKLLKILKSEAFNTKMKCKPLNKQKNSTSKSNCDQSRTHTIRKICQHQTKSSKSLPKTECNNYNQTVSKNVIENQSKDVKNSSEHKKLGQLVNDIKKRRCHHKKYKKMENNDDASVILTGNSVPKPIKNTSKPKITNEKKRKVKLGSISNCNMQDLIITQDVQVKSKQRNCLIKVNMNIMPNAFMLSRNTMNRHKFRHCTVPKERIQPHCFRNNCCKNRNNFNRSIKKKHCKTRRQLQIKERLARWKEKNLQDTMDHSGNKPHHGNKRSRSLSSLVSNLSSDSLNFADELEDISQNSFQSDSSHEEIDMLIKRAKERERKNPKTRNRNTEDFWTMKQPRTSTPYSPDYSEIILEQSRDSITDSNNSRVTMVLETLETSPVHSLYSPTSFSPIFDYTADLEDPLNTETEYEKDMSLDTSYSPPRIAKELFKGYSDIDTTQNIKQKHDSPILNCSPTDNKVCVKQNETLLLKEEVLEKVDNDIIDTALFSSSLAIKTEKLDYGSDIIIIKKNNKNNFLPDTL